MSKFFHIFFKIQVTEETVLGYKVSVFRLYTLKLRQDNKRDLYLECLKCSVLKLNTPVTFLQSVFFPKAKIGL